MNTINLYNPKKIVFGQGSFSQALKDYASQQIERIFILTIQPVLEIISDRLEELSSNGIQVTTNISLETEPTFSDFDRLLKDVHAFNPDCIAGIGGGSVLDMAKVLAVFATSSEPINKYIGTGLLTERKTHLVCIPTTSGTGSEVSPNSILIDETDGAKKGIISPFLVPDSSYIDPELTLGLPREITAYTGIDALTHCIEAIANRNAHPYIDCLAAEGISLISENLKLAYESGDILEARTKLAMGSLYGGMCLGPVNTAAVHALAYPLGTMYKIAHGLSNALLLPYVVDFNLPGFESRFEIIAKCLGVEKYSDGDDLSKSLSGKIKELIADCGIPLRLRDIGIKENTIEEMAESALQVQRLLRNNLREIRLKDAIEIYENAF